MKSKTKQETKNTYGWQTPPTTAAQTAFEGQIKEYDTPDPTIPYTFANLKENLNNRLDDPFGMNFSPEVSGAIKTAGNERLIQGQGQALREDRFNRMGAKTGAMAINAAAQAPQLVQTGGSMVGTQTAPIGPAIIGAVGSIGGAAIG
jgi:hypothetical protein